MSEYCRLVAWTRSLIAFQARSRSSLCASKRSLPCSSRGSSRSDGNFAYSRKRESHSLSGQACPSASSSTSTSIRSPQPPPRTCGEPSWITIGVHSARGSASSAARLCRAHRRASIFVDLDDEASGVCAAGEAAQTPRASRDDRVGAGARLDHVALCHLLLEERVETLPARAQGIDLTHGASIASHHRASRAGRPTG